MFLVLIPRMSLGHIEGIEVAPLNVDNHHRYLL